MIDYIYIMLLISFFCSGLRKATDDHMILNGIEKRLWKWVEPRPVHHYWFNPLLGCIYCMASLWGSAIYWAIIFSTGPVVAENWVMWPVVCVGCIYLNGIAYGLLAKVETFYTNKA